MFAKTYSPERVKVYFYNNSNDRVSGFAHGDFFEVTDDSISIRLVLTSDYVAKIDYHIGKIVPITIEIPIKAEGFTEVYKYHVDGILSRKLIGGYNTVPEIVYTFKGRVEKVF